MRLLLSEWRRESQACSSPVSPRAPGLSTTGGFVPSKGTSGRSSGPNRGCHKRIPANYAPVPSLYCRPSVPPTLYHPGLCVRPSVGGKASSLATSLAAAVQASPSIHLAGALRSPAHLPCLPLAGLLLLGRPCFARLHLLSLEPAGWTAAREVTGRP